MVVDYLAVSAGSTKDLTMKVREKLESGFQPLGGIAMAVDASNVVVFAQAMVQKRGANGTD